MTQSQAPAKKPTLQLVLIPLVSAIGAASGIYLSKHYYDLRAGTGGFSSLCNINSTMNCDAVALSGFAELFPGLPLSSFVAGWFVALMIIGFMARVDGWRKEAVLAGSLMSGFASLYSIALLFVMAAIIKKFCLFCLVIDAANFIVFGLFLWMARGNPFSGTSLKKLQTYGWVTIGSLFVMVVVLRPASENMKRLEQSEIRYAVNAVLERKPIEIKIPEGSAVLGNPSAPVTILEFSDFQCPFCKRGALMMKQLLARYDGKIKVVFMPFPLDSACNRLIQRPMHQYACELSRVAHCAGQQGKFEPVYEKIFEDQEFLTAESAKKIPSNLGLDMQALDACVSSDAAKSTVAASIDEGIKAKVASTPTFFINGRFVEGVLPLEAWDVLIRESLK